MLTPGRRLGGRTAPANPGRLPAGRSRAAGTKIVPLRMLLVSLVLDDMRALLSKARAGRGSALPGECYYTPMLAYMQEGAAQPL